MGTIYDNKTDLFEQGVKLRIFTNNAFEVSAKDIQDAMCDMVESLWRDFEGEDQVTTTHGDLLTSIAGSTLVPGVFYSFEYENVHLIANKTTTNVEVAGYTPKTETFIAKATSVNTIAGIVISKDYKNDIIYYDVATNNIGANAVASKGTVLRRTDAVLDISTPFDFRNHTVVRNKAVVTEYASPLPAISRSEIFKSIADGKYYTSFGLSGGLTSTDEINFTSGVTATLPIAGATYPFRGPDGAVITLDAIDVYSDSINVADCKNILIAQGCSDIKITNSSDVEIALDCEGIDINGSRSIKIGSGSGAISIFGTIDCVIKDYCFSLMITSSNDLEFGLYSSTSLVDGVTKGTFKSYSSNNIMINGEFLEIGGYSSSCILNVAEYSKIGERGTACTISDGFYCEIGDVNNNVSFYGGSHNETEGNCNSINLEARDLTGSLVTTSYSPIDYTTFKKGCTNITFANQVNNAMYVSRTTFGENCENLMFDSSVDNCVFHRGIKNKDFRGKILARVSFISPSDITWVYSVGVVTGEFLTPFLNLSGDPETKSKFDGVSSDNGATIIPTTYERVFGWTYRGEPVSAFWV